MALQPGRFIGWIQEADFVSVLREAEHDIAALVHDDSFRAASLYETFIIVCNLKADEIDSEWEFGNFVAGLACGWIQARQAAGADPEMTAKTLSSWMDRDDYGFSLIELWLELKEDRHSGRSWSSICESAREENQHRWRFCMLMPETTE